MSVSVNADDIIVTRDAEVVEETREDEAEGGPVPMEDVDMTERPPPPPSSRTSPPLTGQDAARAGADEEDQDEDDFYGDGIV